MNSSIIHDLGVKSTGFMHQTVLFLPKLFAAVIVLLIFWLIALSAQAFIRRLANKAQDKATILNLLAKTTKMIILAVGVVTALGTIDINVTALVTSLGLVGFAVGFALKDSLSNLLAGFMILFYHPFRVGDTITSGSSSGEVMDINLRYTVVKNKEQTALIPNSSLLNNVVTITAPTDS